MSEITNVSEITNFLKKSIFLLGLVFVCSFVTLRPTPVFADAASDACEGLKLADPTTKCGGADTKGSDEGFSGLITTIVNTLSIIVGALAVIMIIIGGFRYVISGGDSNGISGAKNTILYAIVGLVVVLFAQVIVRFVYTAATKTPSTTPANSSDAQSDTTTNTTDAEPVTPPQGN